MSDSSPRWPSASGAPGLDFSPRKPEERAGEGAAAKPPATNGYAAPTELPNSSAGTPASAPSPDAVNGSSPAGPPSFAPAPRQEAKASPAESTESAAEQTRTVPAIAGRAARTAQDWANKARTAVTSRTGNGSGNTQQAGGTAAGAAVGYAVGSEAARQSTQSPDTREQPAVSSPVPGGSYPEPRQGAKRSVRRTRKARLRLSRLDPWSVMKTTFLFSIAFGVMMVVATFMIWSVLSGSGALESTNQLINTLIGDEDTVFDIGEFLSMSRVLGFATVVGAIDVVILTAVATLFAFLYNLAATVMGGLEITLAED